MRHDELPAKLERMKEILRSLESVAVAFSAGVDSTFVLKVALDTLGRENVVAITGRSPSVPRSELEEASRLADELGVSHEFLDTEEFANENYVANPSNRCYFCKTVLYRHLREHIRSSAIKAVVNGINADDLGDWRPGIKAAGEHEVHAPIAEAGITKDEVRILSKDLGLSTFDKPAGPCLSSRVQYGETITPEKLHRIDRAEAYLKSLGIRECRVRHHDQLARIEINPRDMAVLMDPQVRVRTEAHFRELGYKYVTLDLRGFRSGSMNEVIQLNIAK